MKCSVCGKEINNDETIYAIKGGIGNKTLKDNICEDCMRPCIENAEYLLLSLDREKHILKESYREKLENFNRWWNYK